MKCSTKELDAMRRRACFWSIIPAFASAMCLIMQALVYRFDARMMLWSLANLGAMGLLLLPPVIYAAWRRFRPIHERCSSPSEGEAQELSSRLEGYPLFVALLVLAAVSVLSLESGLLWFLRGEMLGVIALCYVSMGLAVGVAASFLEFFVLHRILRPLRGAFYPGLKSLGGVPAITIATRITALAVLLTGVAIVLGWTTAEVNSIHAVQDQVLERNRIHAKLLGDQFAGLLCAEASYRALGGKVKVERISEKEYVELLDRGGNREAVFTEGGLEEKELDAGLLAEARKRVVEEPTANGSLSDRRGGLIAAYSPTGYYGLNLVTVVPLSPFLGMARQLAFTFLFLSLIIAAISVVVAWLTVNSFNKPLKRLVEAAGEMERGNLSLDVPVDSADEAGELSLAFRRMLRSLREMIGNSKRTALLVMGEASGTYANASDISKSIGKVKHSIQDLSHSTRMESERLELVKDLSERSADATSRIARLIQEIRKDSQRSLEWMEKSRQRMDSELALHPSHREALEELYAYLQKTAELSNDIASLTQEAMEQNAITMRTLNEIHALAEQTAFSTIELSNDVEEHIISMDQFTVSSQKLAELAIVLQAQTAEFVTD